MSFNQITDVHIDEIGQVPVKSSYNDFVSEYVEDHELPDSSAHFAEDFVISLEDCLEDVGRTPEELHRYAAAVGAREASETTHTFEEVENLNSEAAIRAIAEDRGYFGSLASTLSPLGHGFGNPHRKTEDVCMDEIMAATYGGFSSYRDKQLDRGI